MDEATQLGAQMASQERAIRPDLRDASQELTYVQFLELHRHRLEQHPAFARWDTRITEIGRREAAVQQMNLDRSEEFERYLRQIGRPLRCSFWYGWETAVGLRQMVDSAAAQRGTGGLRNEMGEVRREAELGAYAERVRIHSGGSGLYDLTITELEVRPGDVRPD